MPVPGRHEFKLWVVLQYNCIYFLLPAQEAPGFSGFLRPASLLQGVILYKQGLR